MTHWWIDRNASGEKIESERRGDVGLIGKFLRSYQFEETTDFGKLVNRNEHRISSIRLMERPGQNAVRRVDEGDADRIKVMEISRGKDRVDKWKNLCEEGDRRSPTDPLRISQLTYIPVKKCLLKEPRV